MPVVDGTCLLRFLYGITAIDSSTHLVFPTEEDDLTLVDRNLHFPGPIFHPAALLCRNDAGLYLEDHDLLLHIVRAFVRPKAVGVIHEPLFFVKSAALHRDSGDPIAFFIKNESPRLFILFQRTVADRSEEHTSELQSRPHLVC